MNLYPELCITLPPQRARQWQSKPRRFLSAMRLCIRLVQTLMLMKRLWANLTAMQLFILAIGKSAYD